MSPTSPLQNIKFGWPSFQPFFDGGKLRFNRQPFEPICFHHQKNYQLFTGGVHFGPLPCWWSFRLPLAPQPCAPDGGGCGWQCLTFWHARVNFISFSVFPTLFTVSLCLLGPSRALSLFLSPWRRALLVLSFLCSTLRAKNERKFPPTFPATFFFSLCWCVCWSISRCKFVWVLLVYYRVTPGSFLRPIFVMVKEKKRSDSEPSW